MGFRRMLVEELVRQVLGPLDGPEEVIDATQASPLSLYLTGVLEPSKAEDVQASGDPELEPIRLEGAGEGSEEDQEDGEIAPPPVPLPALNPASRPSVFGIAFELLAPPEGTAPAIEVLLTWGRYLLEEDDGRKVWKRYPDSQHFDRITLDRDQVLPARDLRLYVRLRRSGRRVRVFLQARTAISEEGEIDERCVFQPSLRVRILEGEAVPLGSEEQTPTPDGEQAVLAYGYRKLPVLARGLLCSATWKEVDPEREGPEGERWAVTWADVRGLSPDLAKRFTAPDLRTEFVPLFAISAPEWRWNSGDPPELSAETLSSSVDPARVVSWLKPLVDGYREWVLEQEAVAASRQAESGAIAARIVEALRDTLRRMDRGLELLRKDENARMAFAFANRALWLQARWDGREVLRWRPFQLAFLLATIESAARPESQDRDVCDVLWVPTGGGKTEAYLALVAFVMAYRRRTRRGKEKCGSGGGTAVISRYTLRLLTLQQFRRALKVITACDYLRIFRDPDSGKPGWRPEGAPDGDFPWGTERFSAGIWVGGAITPNKLKGTWDREANRAIPGALETLSGNARGEGEPAQVTSCPTCGALLAVPSEGLRPGEHLLHLVVRRKRDVGKESTGLPALPGRPDGFEVAVQNVTPLPSGFEILTVRIRTDRPLNRRDLDGWWGSGPAAAFELGPFAVSRPGYFPRFVRGRQEPVDFEIWCPSPTCPLGKPGEGGIWWETAPRDDLPFHRGQGGGTGGYTKLEGVGDLHRSGSGMRCVFRRVIDPWVAPGTNGVGAVRVPVPALTVDEQVYARPPSLLVGTVDKFARLAYEPRSAHLIGNVDFYHPWYGYAGPATRPENTHRLGGECDPLPPPELILQDELHLVEGPLGSLVGLYEAALENLITEGPSGFRPKYVASSATIREAGTQVRAIFDRRIALFPPPGLDASDRFFVRGGEAHPLNETRPGQLYAGIAAPGAGTLKPIYRVWAVLLQAVHDLGDEPDHEFFQTLVGYFNAIRELAGGRALTRQDIPEHLRFLERLTGRASRPFSPESVEELSGRIDSTDLPGILDRIASGSSPPDALLTTSMFGTGIDLPRLSLMVIHGQPKTTASYIQAAGRVGRRRAGLVISLLRPSRPRDLSHYEFFVGYHRQIYRHVEPVTVMPFAPSALHRAAGPVMVAMLRNGRHTAIRWGPDSGARAILDGGNSGDLDGTVNVMVKRSLRQPEFRRPDGGSVENLLKSGLDRWLMIARHHDNLVYVEYGRAEKPVVLGDPLHGREGLPVVFDNAPQSLREIEETIGIEY